MKLPNDWPEHREELKAIFARFWGLQSAWARFVGIDPAGSAIYVGPKGRTEPRASVAFRSVVWLERERRKVRRARAAHEE